MGCCETRCFQGLLSGPRISLGLQASLYLRHGRLHKHLRSTVEGERVYGLEAVGRLESQEALRYVEDAVRLLEDPVWSVRHAAASFLVNTPDSVSRCAPLLERLLRGTDASLQLLAAAILRSSLSVIAEAQGVECQRDGPSTKPCDLADASKQRLALANAILADRSLALSAVQVAGESLKYVREEFRNDREIVFTALHQCGQALRHAPDEFWGDRAAVLAAVARDGLALRHATDELQRNSEVVATATGQNEAAIGFAAVELRDAVVLRELLGENTMLLEQWRATEFAVFGKGLVDHSSAYLDKRPEFMQLMRDLAISLKVPDCWMDALTLLDALHGAPWMGEAVRIDSAIAAVMLSGRMKHGRLNYFEHGPAIALHFGRSFELKEPQLKVLRSAEVNIFRALGGRLMVPSVASWTDALFSRLAMLATSDLAQPIREAGAIAQRMAEVLTLRLPGSAKTPPSMLAVAACCTALVGVGLLPMDELLWPGGDVASTTSGAMAVCKNLEGESEPSKIPWPEPQSLSGPRLEAALLAKVVGGDVASLRKNVLATLCAAK